MKLLIRALRLHKVTTPQKGARPESVSGAPLRGAERGEVGELGQLYRSRLCRRFPLPPRLRLGLGLEVVFY